MRVVVPHECRRRMAATLDANGYVTRERLKSHGWTAAEIRKHLGKPAIKMKLFDMALPIALDAWQKNDIDAVLDANPKLTTRLLTRVLAR